MNSHLPESVVQRLQLERERVETGAFSSALGVGEMLLARESGYRVLGQVMGASVWQLAGQRVPPKWSSGFRDSKGLREELTTFSQSIARARELAVKRLREEARLLGAHGVVGVRLHFGKNQVNVPQPQSFKLQVSPASCEWKIVLTGTAVRGRTNASTRLPFTSHLSGEETWKLERAGYAPRALVMGNCVLLQILSDFRRKRLFWARFQGGQGSFEVTQYTNALYAARKLALSRLEAQAQKSGAHRVIGVQIDAENYSDIAELGWSGEVAKPSKIFSLSAIGTAICPAPALPSNSIETIINLQ